ncbi:hypothetical protein HI145_RS02015 [Escherichia coli]|nr:hypothetical protein [Escherichia coli]EGE5776603.1 hypothetical protein [Escherichia coli]
MQKEMIYLTHDEFQEKMLKANNITLKFVPNQSIYEMSANVLFQKLPYVLGTDKQEFMVQNMIEHLAMSIMEKVNAK